MKRGIFLFIFLALSNLVSAQEVNPIRNFGILLVEVVLLILVILIFNYHILENHSSAQISKQINRIFLVLLLFFSVLIRATNKCRQHQETFLLFAIIMLGIALFFYLPDKEMLNRVFLLFIAISVVLLSLHAVDHSRAITPEGCSAVVAVGFFQSPPLEIILAIICLGFFLITIIEAGWIKRLKKWAS